MRCWRQRADESRGNRLQGNQEPLVVKDRVRRPPGELGVSKSTKCDTFSPQYFETVGYIT